MTRDESLRAAIHVVLRVMEEQQKLPTDDPGREVTLSALEMVGGMLAEIEVLLADYPDIWLELACPGGHANEPSAN